MNKKRIITDDVDLANKTPMTDDVFYGDKKLSSDSTSVSPIYKGDSRFFALLSTSDKVINNRMYNKDSWKKTVLDGTWQGPLYAKPMIRNHDIRSQVPFGRIKDSYFVEHGSFEVSNKDGKKIESKVLDFYKGCGALTEGSGSVIVEFTSDEITANRMEAGLDITVSQSSYFKEATCSICGQDYFGGECIHMAGRTYQIKKDDVSVDLDCIVMTKDFEPIELSIVNTPANDTSVIYVHKPRVDSGNDSEDTTESSNDSQEEPKIDEDKNSCKDSDNNKPNVMEDKNKMFKKMLKDTLKANIEKEISDKAEMLTAFEALFDAANEDTLPLVKTLMDEIAVVVKAIKEVADSEEVEAAEAGTEEAEDAVKAEEATEATGEAVEAEDTTNVEEEIKDALGVIKEAKVSNDNKILNTIIKGLKL
ncbi:MAG: hypothetical protein ACRCX2_22820 [Paraclostridium sp.]